MMRSLAASFVALVVACGSTSPAHEATPIVEAEQEPTAIERACLTGSTDNGVCEIFSAALEPLGPLASHCHEAHGQWLETCPTAGRVGSCSGEGRRAIYYGVGLGTEALQRACAAEGHTFAP